MTDCDAYVKSETLARKKKLFCQSFTCQLLVASEIAKGWA